MKRVVVVLFAVVVTSVYGGEVAKCFEYNPNDFTLEITRSHENGKMHTATKKLDALKVYFRLGTAKPEDAVIEYAFDGQTYRSTEPYCLEENNMCVIECDGGDFAYDKHYGIRTEGIDIYRDYEKDEVTKRLFSKKKKHFTDAKEIACPHNIERPKELDDSYYEDHPGGKNVCYDYKEGNKKYFGCIRSIKTCRFIHRQRFGSYPTKKESKAALIRCKTSRPNRDYVDNKKGRYVCYDYRDDNGDYSGCFRSLKSCEALHRMHFGKYHSTKESAEAFIRCKHAIPRR